MNQIKIQANFENRDDMQKYYTDPEVADSPVPETFYVKGSWECQGC